jgi:hypothetical protein
MPKVPVPWDEWRPDLATLDGKFCNDVENVFPGSNSYQPVPDLAPFTDSIIPPSPLTEPVVGLTSARTTSGDWRIYGGTRTKLYRWTLFTGWVEVGSGYNAPIGELWSFAQFGKYLIAVQIGDTPQFCDVDANTNFAPLTNFPVGEKAHNVRTIGDFVIMGGLLSNRRKIMWSGINDPFSWTPGISLSDEQEMPDGGPVMGISGDKIGYVCQDRAIRLLQFLPGDTTFIFSLSKVVYDRGSISEFGYTSIGDTLYFRSEDGFYALSGSSLIPIGHEKINEWFLAHSDIGRANVIQAVTAVRPFIAWAYHASSGSPAEYYDSLLIFNWSNQRWSRWRINAQMWAGAAVSSTNLDLDTTGPEPGDALLDSAARSLDSFAYQGGRPRVAAINPDGYLSELAGPNLQATLESGEVHLVPGNRALVGEVYPLADGAEGVIYDGYRERLQDAVTWTVAAPIEITGSAAIYNSARLHRFRHIIPRSSKWTHAQGVIVDAQDDGSVA